MLAPSLRGGLSGVVRERCQAAYHVWLEQRRSRASGCLRVNLHVNDYLEIESRMNRFVYRFDDDESARSKPLSSNWSRILRNMHNTSPGARKEFLEYVKLLDDADREDEADFVRALRVGDEIGVWSGSKESGYVTVVEGVRVTVFWEV